ncbi:MAG TPA: ABC transporter substrate-binding protein [Stellaceae bacterium]|nr:ABC transporter substrate-binding protein [Stellaceae bacterium]
MTKCVGALVAATLVLASPAGAQDLKIALAAEPTSIDPLYHTLNPNNQVARHIFDRLVHQDAKQRLVPGLAVSWKPIMDAVWEFKLRPGVTFQDGAALTADDVIFSIERADKVPNSPASFAIYTKAVKGIEVIDPLTLHIKTGTPYPLLPNDLSTVAIQAKRAAAGKGTEDFNNGTAAIGTGPYKFVEWVPGNRLVLARNDKYWGPKPDWAKVTMRPIPNNAARVAALLAGDVDFMENVPTADLARLKQNPVVRVVQTVSNRVIYLHLDSNRDQSPFVLDNDGKPLPRNPLKDRRVRLAISKAINRAAIVERVMEGAAIPAGQLLPDGFFGVSPNLKPMVYDPEGAKRLLAEAGYPEGFRLTLHSPNDRYVNDEKVAQAVAQMLSRVGIKTDVQAMPQAVYFSRASKLEFSFMLLGWGADTGEPSSPLKSLLATTNPAKGMGTANRGRYSNPKLDALLEEALATVDDEKRAGLLAQATEAGIEDAGIIPLHYEVTLWGMRSDLTFEGNTSQYTQAFDIHPVKK